MEPGFSLLSPPAGLEQETLQVYLTHGRFLVRYAQACGADAAAADDMAQEALLRYFLVRLEGREIAHPKAWLLTVVKNLRLEQVRSAANRTEQLTQAESFSGVDHTAFWSVVWQQALSLLSPRERECLELRRDGLQYDDIASQMGIRPGTVAALLARAQAKVRGQFAEVSL